MRAVNCIMKCQSDIEQMADLRLREATCLLVNGFCDGAYYLAGYSVELLLKARVCKLLDIDDFFTFSTTKRKELYKAYKVHNFQELVILSGLYSQVEAAQAADKTFKSHWSLICLWSEDSRYLTGKSKKDASDFVVSIHEISKWIKTKL